MAMAISSNPHFTIITFFSLLLFSSNFLISVASNSRRRSLGINITKTLTESPNFTTGASLFGALGIAKEFEQQESGAGITLFVPTDEAFAELLAKFNFTSLPVDKQALVLRFHGLLSYYPPKSLKSIVNPKQPTFATEFTGAGKFTLNIFSFFYGKVVIDTGIVQALVTEIVFEKNAVAVYGISKVLLPKEIFKENQM